jgi:hypothetical protein
MSRILLKGSSLPWTKVCLARGRRRSISCSGPLRDVFTVQDEDDFKVKVLQNKKPTVVDFHAK